MKRILISLMLFSCIGCAGMPKVVKVACPPRPSLLPVEVKGGTLDKENTQNIIENWLRTYEYVRRIEKLGCTK